MLKSISILAEVRFLCADDAAQRFVNLFAGKVMASAFSGHVIRVVYVPISPCHAGSGHLRVPGDSRAVLGSAETQLAVETCDY